MNEEYLIRNTTRKQREQIVKEALGYSDVACDGCASGYGFDLYEDYIEGKKELSEITMGFHTSFVREDLPEADGECGFAK